MFDISGLTSAGSIAGAGNYFLGAKVLSVGGNNLSTTASGVVSDGGLSGGIGGAIIKVGTGTLTNTETYRREYRRWRHARRRWLNRAVVA